MTSKADEATGVAFPLGRWINTVVESFTDGDQRKEARTAFGHYAPFVTHDLSQTPGRVVRPADEVAATVRGEVERGEYIQARCAELAAFRNANSSSGHLKPGWSRTFPEGAVLTQRDGIGYDPDSPFWVVQTDKPLIADHSDIDEPAFIDVIRQIYDDPLLDARTCAGGAHGPEPR